MAEEEGAKESPPAKKSKLLIIIIALVIVIACVGTGLFFALSGGEHKEAEGEEEAELEETAVDRSELPGAVLPLDVFIVNLRAKGSYLKAVIQLEFFEPEIPQYVENEIPKIRDSIIRVLSSKSSKEVLSIDGKERLKEEVLEVVNEAIGAEEVSRIFFTEFIVQ